MARLWGEADTPELDQLIMPRLLNVPGLEELVVVVVYVWLARAERSATGNKVLKE